MTALAVRWRDGGFEAKCPLCDEYLELTAEFWRSEIGLSRCRACWADYYRLRQLHYTADEATRVVSRFKNRLQYALVRDARLAYNRAYKESHAEQLNAYRRAYRARADHPGLLEQYHRDYPDRRLARDVPLDGVAERRRQWRESKRRVRGLQASA